MMSKATLRSRKSSCPGQPVPALAQGLLAWWGRDQISKGDSSPASLFIDFKWRQGRSTITLAAKHMRRSVFGLEA